MGLISPLGNTACDVLAQARAGRSAVHRLELSFAARLTAPLAATAAFDGSQHGTPAQQRMLDRLSQMALFAAPHAVTDSPGALIDLPGHPGGVFSGTGMGGTLTMDAGYQMLIEQMLNKQKLNKQMLNEQQSDRIKPFTILMGMHNAAPAWVGMQHGLEGPNLTYSTACSSSAVAIGEAWLRVASGQLEVALARGAEAPLSNGSLKAWEALHTLATQDARTPSASCRPFSKNRSGMVLGEGAAMLVLEPWTRARARGAFSHGEIIGYGLSNHASDITRPSVQGLAAAMRAALLAAATKVQQVDAINAHGTGTPANDSTETAAIRALFGAHAERLLVSATKALHGHLLGAAGALECVLSLLAMQQRVALPTMHWQAPDPTAISTL